MSSQKIRAAGANPTLRLVASMAALSVLCIAGSASATPAQTSGHHHGASTRRETVDQRIASLHHALKITPDEETSWAAVAQTMRWNEAAMQKLIADRKVGVSQGATALDDLKTYEQFNRAHVEGLKDLIASFGTLYNAMPDTQKIVADHVFQKFNRNGFRSNG